MGSIDGSSKEQYERIVAFLLKYNTTTNYYNTEQKKPNSNI